MTKKRKLKGINIKRIPEDKRKKMEKTLARMDETREKDSINLRTIIEAKLKWAIAEKQKGTNQLETLKIQIYRLEGIIIFIKDILNPSIKEDK